MHEVKVKGILSADNGMNLYRGCTHGCIYCDSRSRCYQMDHDFEDIEVKINAPELLEAALKRKRRRCMIGTGAMCDPYLPLEETCRLTRRCLELIDAYGYGVTILTKSDRILRDLDLLKRINKKTKCVVQMTLTTFDEDLCRILEPNVSTTKQRYQVLKVMQENHIPTIVWMTPILPFINDTPENIHGLLNYCIDAGVRGILSFGMGLTLREGDREYFYQKLDEHFPGLRAEYERTYGCAYHIPSPRGKELTDLLRRTCRRHGIMYGTEQCFRYLHEFEDKGEGIQMRLPGL